MIQKICYSAVLLGFGLIAAACSTVPKSSVNKMGWSYVNFTDPVCGQITLEILNSFHIPHKTNTIPYEVWNRWVCIRNTNKFGRVTVVLLHESKTYRLTLIFGKDRRVIKANTDPIIWQEVIGSMADYAHFDSLTSDGRNYLTKNDSIDFNFDVRP
ncbi:MAG: hypothetical protein ACRESE_02325 [Gammaproteobacteria bacterium]